jgi:hypothetical protein
MASRKRKQEEEEGRGRRNERRNGDETQTQRRRNGSARLQSCRQSRNPTHSVIPNEVWDLLFPPRAFLRDVLCGIARLSRDVLCGIARLSRDESAFLRLERALTRLPARALVGAQHAVPLFHFRLSTVDCRPLHRRPRYRVAGFSGLNTPCGLSFQIHAWTSQGDLAMKWPPFSVHWDSVRP